MIRMLYMQTLRNIKIFLKNKANIFFALLTPLIAIALYVLFLGKLQTDAVLPVLRESGFPFESEKYVRAFFDCWMIAGVISVACVTAPLCAAGVSVDDRSRGICDDLLSSPVPKWLASASYFLSVVLSGLTLCAAVLIVCFVWILCSGCWYLSAADIFAIIGEIVLSVLSSSTIFVLITSFVKTQGAFSGINIIIGTIVGFITGAYIPVSVLGEGMQYASLSIPAFYSSAIFRNLVSRGILNKIGETVNDEFSSQLAKQYGTTGISVGNISLNIGELTAILAASVVIFILLNLAVSYILKRTKK